VKTSIVALFLVLASAVSAFGSACIVASYDNYLGANFSCGIDDKTFSNFFYSTAGTNPMPASSITVNPITTPFNPGFLFNAPWAVQAGQTQDSLIGLTATVNQNSDHLIDDLTLQMFGAGVVGSGQVSIAETYCAGDTFANNCANGIEGTLLTILNANTSILHASVSFGPVRVVDVMKDVELLGGANGSASLLSGVQNQFSETEVPGVPEPGTMLLTGMGALGLAGAVRRKLLL